MPKLLLLYEGAVIEEIPVTKGEITVGRKPDNDIIIDYPVVSGHHCKITRVGDTFVVEDTNSSNGVFLNSQRILKSGLKNNDVIGIARHSLQFVDDRPETDEIRAVPPPPPPSPPTPPEAATKPAFIRVVKGIVAQSVYELTAPSTYIGKSDRAQIKIKGAGFFGGGPDNAAMITNRPEGYFIVPIEANYAKLNGKTVGQKERLKNGDLIQAGKTILRFED